MVLKLRLFEPCSIFVQGLTYELVKPLNIFPLNGLRNKIDIQQEKETDFSTDISFHRPKHNLYRIS